MMMAACKTICTTRSFCTCSEIHDRVARCYTSDDRCGFCKPLIEDNSTKKIGICPECESFTKGYHCQTCNPVGV